MLAVFSVMPYELSTRTPEMRSNSSRTAAGKAVEPVMKLGSSEERSIRSGRDLASTAKVVGTPERRVTRYLSTNRQ